MIVMPKNTFKRALHEDREQLGLWLSTGSATMAELAGNAPFDWFLIDGEHGPNTVETIQAQLLALDACRATAIVRPAESSKVLIKQALDVGAQTLLLPMINSADEARDAVAATRYPPDGVRGVGPSIARVTRWGRVEDYVTQANDEICVLLQIESKAAVDALDEILAVPGVDGLFIGPVDLGSSLGYPPKDELNDIVCGLLGRIRDAGLAAGSLAFDTDTAQLYLEAGAKFVAVASDTDLYVRALDAASVAVRRKVG